jgi:hypothetical protein
MPDITMCEGENCPQKETCYRYTATPSRRQSYFEKPPFKEGEFIPCGFYWYNEKG